MVLFVSELLSWNKLREKPSEINFWLPLSDRVYGGNTLWAETRPGLLSYATAPFFGVRAWPDIELSGQGDFHPFELRLGQVMRFYGNQVTAIRFLTYEIVKFDIYIYIMLS